IVFAAATDAVGAGLVASLARPGGNVTGLSLQQTDAAGKRLALLREIVPGLRHLAILANVSAPGSVLEMGEVQAAAPTTCLEATTLESYGPNGVDRWKRTAEIVDKILRGTKPADIPVEQPTKFDLVINLTTAKVLGLKVPDKLLVTADEVIE